MAQGMKQTGRSTRSVGVRGGASEREKDATLMRAKMELVAARERGEPGALARVAALYPARAAELVEFGAALIATTSYENEAPTPAIDALAERARAKAFATVFAAATPSAPAAVAATSLAVLRKARSLSQMALAKQLGLGVDVVSGIERGAIKVASIPERLVRALGHALNTSADQVQAILHSQTMLLPALNRGGAGEEPELDFARAVELSPNMTPEQKARWLSSGDGE